MDNIDITKVLGINSLIEDKDINKSIFFYDIDRLGDERHLHILALSLLDKYNYETVAYKSSKNSYHLIGFEIKDIWVISTLQEFCRAYLDYEGIKSDYMNIYDTMDKFGEGNTLRIGFKKDKSPPEYHCSFIDRKFHIGYIANNHLEFYHYRLGLHEQEYWNFKYNYRYYQNKNIKFILYGTKHNLEVE